jgi:hypothetical protein
VSVNTRKHGCLPARASATGGTWGVSRGDLPEAVVLSGPGVLILSRARGNDVSQEKDRAPHDTRSVFRCCEADAGVVHQCSTAIRRVDCSSAGFATGSWEGAVASAVPLARTAEPRTAAPSA